MIGILAFWTVFTAPALIIAVVGGSALGWLLGSYFPPNPLVRSHRVLTAFGIIGFIGVVFFAGQTVEVYFGADRELWTRLLARGLIWLVFSAALALAATMAQRHRWGR